MTFRQVGVAEAISMRDAGVTVIDVREPVEWQAGHIAGAAHIPLAEIPTRLADLPAHDAPLLLYCRFGARSSRVAEYLAAQGFTAIANLDAMLTDWRAQGGAWEEPAPVLDPADERRYARQILLPEVGVEGQQRLLDAKVLVVGAGGLGSPVAIYLAAAGVGTIGIIDDDLVEESNLHRQVLHHADRVGMRKVDSAAQALAGLNPATRVLSSAERLDAASADRLIAGWDVVVDGTDNLDARYALNDAAVRRRTPLVHASVYRWEGQLTTIVPFVGPCYRCLHPQQPPDELVPACDVAGVMGVLPGLIGTLQATEVLKLLLGIEGTLVGRQLLVDARAMTFDEVSAERDPACPACGSLVGTQ